MLRFLKLFFIINTLSEKFITPNTFDSHALLRRERLEWATTHQCTIQKIPFWDFMDGMKLSHRGQFTWSIDLFFLLLLFFLARYFSLVQFFFSGNNFIIIFFLAHPWPQVFFWEAPTDPPNLNPPSSHILLAPSPPISFCTHFHCQSFRSATRCQELQHGGSWSVKTRGARCFRSVVRH